MKTSSRLIPVALLALSFSGGSMYGAPILVTNPSFETLPAGGLSIPCTGTGCSYSTDPVPGWIAAGGGSGQFQPGTTPNTYFDTLSDGPTNAYINNAGATLSQTVFPVVQTGVTYTLEVDLGFRKDTAFAASVDLLINGILYPAIGVVPVQGNWSTYTATYVGLAADAGQAITIVLNASGVQANYDNVRLSDSLVAIPEPGGVLLFATGMLLVLSVRRFRPSR